MDTHDYVMKLQENERKAEKNRHRGKRSPGSRLANKQHSTNK